MPRVSEDHKAEMRGRLVDAAVAITLESGPTQVTTRKVLEAAGMSTGALYHYFSSKDELFEAVAQRFVELDDALFPADLEHATAEQLVEHHSAMVAALFERGQRSVLGPLRVASQSSDLVGRSLDHFDRATVQRSAAVNTRSKDLGLFGADVDSEALVEVMEVFFEAFVTRDHLGSFVTSRERVLRLFIEMIFGGVIDRSHPLAAELRRRLLAVADQ